MNKIIFIAMAVSAVMTGCVKTSENPLLGEFNTPHQTPPFNEIKLEHYIPAFKEGIARARAETDLIVNDPDAPTFENTIEALERSGELLGRTARIFFALNSSNTSDEMEAIAEEIQPWLTEYSNDISLNPVLFGKVKTVYDYYHNRKWESDPLDPERWMLLDKTYKGFTRSGAALNEKDKEHYRELTQELGLLTLKFGQNVLAENNAFSYVIPPADSAKVGYMPEFVRAAMAEDAAAHGVEGWRISLDMPSYGPFMKYSRERDIKEALWRAYSSRGYSAGQRDNREIVSRIANLRLELARLLGYETFADYVLEERMAGSRETVDGFLAELLAPTKEQAVADYRQVVEYAAGQPGSPADFMPWDLSYYDEKYKTEKYAINQELIKPYLKLENVEAGSFMLAERLFGITFKYNPEIQVYHPDVKAYEVFDKDGSFLSVLYVDYFPRASKRGGAWMTNFRDTYTKADGTVVRPLVTLNYNFTKPTADTPSLLTFDEFSTVLHEFGHGLHGMLAQGRYSSLTGTRVYRDFVELPSQILENWATEKEFLDLWAVHYRTGEKIPAELVEKIIRAKNYMAAYAHVRQLWFGFNDMAWHSITSPVEGDPAVFERRATAGTQILPLVDGACVSTAFSHIFAGGYAAGYYGYKWAEVLEADAFSLFKERGIFSPEVGAAYRKLLEAGGSVRPMELYVAFRGHEPETKALINKILGLE